MIASSVVSSSPSKAPVPGSSRCCDLHRSRSWWVSLRCIGCTFLIDPQIAVTLQCPCFFLGDRLGLLPAVGGDGKFHADGPPGKSQPFVKADVVRGHCLQTSCVKLYAIKYNVYSIESSEFCE